MPGLLTPGCQTQDGKKISQSKKPKKMPNPPDNTELPVSSGIYACLPIVVKNTYKYFINITSVLLAQETSRKFSKKILASYISSSIRVVGSEPRVKIFAFY